MTTPYLGNQIEVLMNMSSGLRKQIAWLSDCVKMIGGVQIQHLPVIEELASNVTGDLENLAHFQVGEANRKLLVEIECDPRQLLAE